MGVKSFSVDYSEQYGCWVVWERFANIYKQYGIERRVFAYCGSQRIAEEKLKEAKESQ
jgi:hypothetical protein